MKTQAQAHKGLATLLSEARRQRECCDNECNMYTGLDSDLAAEARGGARAYAAMAAQIERTIGGAR